MSDLSQVVCPQCWVVNRVPTLRLISAPKCGKCKQLLFDGQPVELSMANFNHFTQRNHIPIMVDFWAPWCGLCQTMSLTFKDVAIVLEPHIRLAKVNIDVEKEIASRLQISNTPCLVIFVHGQEVARKDGAMDSFSLVQWANNLNISALA
jgi:thioredoxin 2